MNMYWLSVSEVKNIVERAMLPDSCECSVVNGVLSLRAYSPEDPKRVICITGIKTDSLTSVRSVAELIGEARYQLARPIPAPSSQIFPQALRLNSPQPTTYNHST